MEYKFKVGDRVRVLRSDMTVFRGDTGTVVQASFHTVAVEFDRNLGSGGHSCDGDAKNGHGRYMSADNLDLLAVPVRLIITKDGDTTTARRVCGKKDITEVSVKRYYKDTDDEFLAAIRAVEKLYGRSVRDLCEVSNDKEMEYVTIIQEYANRQKALALRLLSDLKEVDKKENKA